MGSSRTGIKRELALLLEGQPQYFPDSSVGRTRASKVGKDGVSETASKRKNKGLMSDNDFGVNGSVDRSLGIEFFSNGCNGVSGNVENEKFECNLVIPMCEEGPNSESAVQFVIKEELNDDDDANVILLSSERGTVETPIVIDDGKPPRRFTRSLLNPKVEPMVDSQLGVDGCGVSEGAMGTPIVIDDGKPPRRFTRSLLKPKVEPMVDSQLGVDGCRVSEGAMGTRIVIDDGKPPRRFTRSLLKPKVDPMVGSQLGVDGCRVSEGAMGTPIVIDDGKPPRRCTRSLLKPKIELMGNLPLGIDGSGMFQGAKKKVMPRVGEAETREPSTPRTSRKKMELKMSKKIEPDKIPCTVKELLGTGLLEGFQVTCYDTKKVSRLQGRIKGLGILCSCLWCKGLKVISPSKFERHAIRVYRHMAKFIYLDNGRSLQEVLTACKESPLDTLESTIQSAIGSLPLTESIGCANCRVGSLCNTCMESKESQASPICMTVRKARSSNPIVVSKSPKSMSLCISSQEKSQWKITHKNMGLHKLVFEEGGLPDGTELGYYARGKKLLEGYKKGIGIFCRCCNCEVSASTFEAHAGFASRKKPYTNIYTSNGVSLHELAISLSKGRKYSSEDSDEVCIICADGGNLLLCDGCPRAFHQECASLSIVPRGNWYCNYCQNMFQKEKFVQRNANAVAAGRISGVDPIKQITQRCIRIVKCPDAEVTTCVLCRGYDYSKCSYGARTIIICDQCEMEYHIGCLKDNKVADLKELPRGKWFCCMDCSRIHSTLQKLLICGAEKLPDSHLSVIQTKQGSDSIIDLDVRWKLLSGKFASPEVRLLLSKAVSIFHECFDPIVDPITGKDLIPPMIYGRNVRNQEFGGMYCAVLLVNSSVVAAGILRVYGREVAELPLVATCKKNQGKGYFQLLFSCIMKLLAFLNVKSIVLPAAHEAESLWVNKFGFKKIAPIKLSNLRKKYCQMITFQGTCMLQKLVPECRIIPKKIE